MVPTCCGSTSPAWTTPTTSASASAASRRCRRPIARSATRFATCWETSRITSDSTRHGVDPAALHEIDRWVLGQLNKVIRDVRAAYERFEFYRVYQRIYQFCAVELSSFYLDVFKDRLYAEAPAGPDRRAAQFVLARLHDHLTRLAGPDHPAHGRGVVGVPARDARQAVERPPGGVSRAEPAVGRRQARCPLGRAAQTSRANLDRARRSAERASRSAVPRRRRSRSPPSRPDHWLAGSRATGDALQRLGGRDRRRPRGRGRDRSRPSTRAYAKCERCWNYRPTVGQSADHPTLCERCVRVLEELDNSRAR